MSEENTTPDGLGLDKGARNALQRESEESAAKEEPRLEPAFPYTLVPFNPSFFD